MFKKLGWIVSIIMIVSTTAALTLVPMLCSRWLKPHEEHGKIYNTFFSPINRFLDRISTANVIRATQTDSLYLALGHHENTRIVMCGDFNDTPISYTYQKLLKRLKNTFRESGIGVGRSFNEKGFFVRIDHIFVSHDWTSHKTCILSQIKLSDHYPIVTYLTKKVK